MPMPNSKHFMLLIHFMLTVCELIMIIIPRWGTEIDLPLDNFGLER